MAWVAVAGAAVGVLGGALLSKDNPQPSAPTPAEQNQATQYNATNPYGSSTWGVDPNTGQQTNTSTYNPENAALLSGTQAGHQTAQELAASLAESQGGNIGAGNTPVGPPPTPKPGQGVINTDPESAFIAFQSTGVIPPGYGVDSSGKLVNTSTGATSTASTESTPEPTPLYLPSASGSLGQVVSTGQDEGVNRINQVALAGLNGLYQSQTGQTVGAAPTLGTVGAAPTLNTVGTATPNQTIAGVGQNQGVTQAQALSQMQMQAPIAAYNGTTPVAGYAGGGDIAGYSAAAPKFGTTATPANLQQFNGQAPTAQMIANGGSVAGAGEGIQKTLDLSNLGNMPTASEATLKQVQDALYARDTGYLDPQFQASQAALDAKLANQGLGIGSRAYDIARAQEASAKEKAYSGARNDAIIMGGAEQSRLFNLQMAARQQGYTEDLGAGNFQNQAQNQGYTQQLANQQNVISGTSANNAAQNAQLAANLAIMQQNNAAKQTDFTNQFNITGQNNASQQALGQYNLGAGTLNANIGNMNAQNALGAGQLNANIGIANNQAALGAGTLNANIANNNFQNTLATNQFNNAAITGNLNNQINAQGFNNTANNQNLANQVTTQGFNNTAANQDYQNMLAGVGFNNTAANQGYQNTLSGANFNNTAANQGYQNAIAGTGFNNAVQQQDVTNQFTQQQLNNQKAQLLSSALNSSSATASAAASRAIQEKEFYAQLAATTNQKQFENYMALQGFNNTVTNTGNNTALDTYRAGLSGTNTNIAGGNSNVDNYIKLMNAGGPVGTPPGPATTGGNPAQTYYLDQNGNYVATNQANNVLLNGIGSVVPPIINSLRTPAPSTIPPGYGGTASDPWYG